MFVSRIMGTERDRCQPAATNRSKPPPVPPRPSHLVPPPSCSTKASISKFSSMPDILNGWRRDRTNPDLLRLNGGVCKLSSYDSSPDQIAPAKRDDDTNSRRGRAYEEPRAKTKTSRKISCIPSRSNSKKRKNGKATTGDDDFYGRTPPIDVSQTNWYVDDIMSPATTSLTREKDDKNLTSSCRTNNYYKKMVDDDCRYVATPKRDSQHIQRKEFRGYRQPQSMATTTPSLNGLPPLPKSLSDASLPWSPCDKKLPAYSANHLSSGSNTSSSSRTSNGVYAKVPLSSSPRLGSFTQETPKSTSVHVAGEKVIRDERRPPGPPPPPPRKPTSLDMKLATLRKEMYDLRQMDLTLLSQLWSLNEAIIEFRQIQISLSPSSQSLHASDEEDSGCYYSNVSSQGMVTSNQHSNTLGSSSSRSSISTNRSTKRDNIKL